MGRGLQGLVARESQSRVQCSDTQVVHLAGMAGRPPCPQVRRVDGVPPPPGQSGLLLRQNKAITTNSVRTSDTSLTVAGAPLGLVFLLFTIFYEC